MPTITARKMPELGEEFNIHTSLLSKVGSCFSIVFNGVRVGVARVVEDHSKNERFTVEKHGGGLTNLAHRMYGVKVERLFGEDDDD